MLLNDSTVGECFLRRTLSCASVKDWTVKVDRMAVDPNEPQPTPVPGQIAKTDCSAQEIF